MHLLSPNKTECGLKFMNEQMPTCEEGTRLRCSGLDMPPKGRYNVICDILL